MTGGLFHVSYSFFSILSVKVLFPGGLILFKHSGFHYRHVTRTVTDVNTYDAPVWRSLWF